MTTTRLQGDGAFVLGEERPFVMKFHVATNAHFDFRLEFNGVLISWAIRKGASLDPGVNRLAVRVADHPMSGFKAERVIPEGEYGAGPLIVWDTGTYRNITRIAEMIVPTGVALESGIMMIELRGSKLRGAFTLKQVGGGNGENWWLTKVDDRWAVPGSDIAANPRSVMTGRTIDELVADWNLGKREPAAHDLSGDLFAQL